MKPSLPLTCRTYLEPLLHCLLSIMFKGIKHIMLLRRNNSDTKGGGLRGRKLCFSHSFCTDKRSENLVRIGSHSARSGFGMNPSIIDRCLLGAATQKVLLHKSKDNTIEQSRTMSPTKTEGRPRPILEGNGMSKIIPPSARTKDRSSVPSACVTAPSAVSCASR